MFSQLTLTHFQIIILLTLLFGIDSYVRDYDYEYSGSDTAERQYSRYHLARRSKGASRGIHTRSYQTRSSPLTGLTVINENNLFEDLLNPNLSTHDADLRVPVTDSGRLKPRSSNGCPTNRCFQCLDSCRHLKTSRIASNTLIQYTYLRLCSMGCKEELECLENNYCLPVMPENPDFFVQCSSKCNLFLIVPKIFKTGSSC